MYHVYVKQIYYAIAFLIAVFINSMHSTELPNNAKINDASVIEKPIIIIICSYNNAEWYTQNLDSVFMQKYNNYHVYYIDDVSQDNTFELVKNYIESHDLQEKCTVIKNGNRSGALLNLYRTIHACDDYALIVTLDGDDWFKHEYVLETVNNIYSQEHVWLTYGQFEGFPNGKIGVCRDYPANIIHNNVYREYDWITSHLRTFYAGLFKRIKLSDFIYKDSLFPVAWDLAMMFPMLEMAGEHSACIHDVLYIYNIQTPLNDFKLREYEQIHCDHLIRTKKKYQPISTLGTVSYHQNKAIDAIILTNTSNKNRNSLHYIPEGISQLYYLDTSLTNTFFSSQLVTLLEHINTDYVLILQDHYHFNRSFSVLAAANMIAQTQAHCFSLALGKSTCFFDKINRTVHCPYLIPVHDGIVAWQFKNSEFMWARPYNLDAVIYTTSSLKNAIRDICTTTYADFVEIINQQQFDLDLIGLCYEIQLVE